MEIVKTSLYIDKKLYNDLKKICIELDITIKEFLNDAVKEKLEKESKK